MRINIDSTVKEGVKACKHVASRERFISEKDTSIAFDIYEKETWLS